MDGDGHIEACNGHGLAGESRHHGAGNDPHFLVAGKNAIAHVRRHFSLHQQTEDLEAFLPLQSGMGARAMEVVLSRTDGEVEPEFPEAVARRVFVEGIHLRHVVGIKQ